MLPKLRSIQTVLSIFISIATIIYLSVFFYPLKTSLLLELRFLMTGFTIENKQNYIEQIIYIKSISPIYNGTVIPWTNINIPFPITWHFYEIGILFVFLITFSLHIQPLNNYWSSIFDFSRLESMIENFSNKHPFILSLIVKANNRVIAPLFLSVGAFVLFAGSILFLHHHGAPRIQYLDNILLAITTATMIVAIIPYPKQSAPIISRRNFIKLSSISLIAAFTPTLLEKLFQSISIKHFPNPRYRDNHAVKWKNISLNAGLYKHKKSKKIYYVNELGLIRSYSKINEANLDRIHSLNLNHSDFPYISKLISATFFEDWSIKLLQRDKLYDALNCLEVGCRYQIYRIKNKNETNPNIRIFKLYVGLCYKNKIKHNLENLRKEITQDKIVFSILQPQPQHWLMLKAWSFKQRWLRRVSYNKNKLTTT